MGLLDKAKAAATDLAAKADTKLANSGLGGAGASASGRDADRYFRDLGVLAYLEASERPASPEDRDRVMTALRGMESQGTIGSFSLQTTAPPPPDGTVPPPPGGMAPPSPGGTAPASAPEASTSPPTQPAPTTPAPPPPSWMTKDENSS